MKLSCIHVQRNRRGGIAKVAIEFDWPKPIVVTITELLAKGGTNRKLAKNPARNKWELFGLSLAPALESTYQTCAGSSAGCRSACIYTSGRAFFPRVRIARVAKTLLWFEHRPIFEELLRQDLDRVVRLTTRNKTRAATRLNVFSDISWEDLTPWVFEYPIQFYDYTKLAKRILRGTPANYDLTFSRSECNDDDVKKILEAGGRVAVVYGIKRTRWKLDRPKWYTTASNRYKVIDGDKSDMRWLDPANCVVGLYAKGKGIYDQTGFVLPVPNRIPLALLK